MKNNAPLRALFAKSAPALSVLASAAFVAFAPRSSAAELIKADNTTNLALQASYTNAAADTGTGDTLRFDDTLVNNGTFSWSADNVTMLKVVDPAIDITINLNSGSTYGLTNASGGTVIDLSGATRDLTLSSGTVRVRGDTTNGATFSIAAGRTLHIQSRLTYNNGSGLANIRATGAGNLTVAGSSGTIVDKDASNFTSFTHEGTGVVTFANSNTYSGGTFIKSGTLVAGGSAALGNGPVNISGGVLDLNGTETVALALAGDQGFAISAGTVKFDLGASSDQIAGSGSGAFNLTGGIIELSLGEGFSYGQVYQLFSGFDTDASSIGGIVISGYDTLNYQADLNNLGQLSFNPASIPEPSATALLTGGALLVGAATRRRR